MSIHIDIPSAKAANEQLPAIVRQVTNAKDTLSKTRISIDAGVLECSNLRTRLKNVQINIEAVESDLVLLHRTITQNIAIYEENEIRLESQAQNLTNKLGE